MSTNNGVFGRFESSTREVVFETDRTRLVRVEYSNGPCYIFEYAEGRDCMNQKRWCGLVDIDSKQHAMLMEFFDAVGAYIKDTGNNCKTLRSSRYGMTTELIQEMIDLGYISFSIDDE